MVNKQKILIVDDDANIAELISLYLTKECFDTMIVEDGESALRAVDTFAPNLILLDLMLPGIDGYQVCREVRSSSSVPIIMLSAKGEIFDKVLGLELGADDYITKPFEIQEVLARIQVQLRHMQQEPEHKSVSYKNLELDRERFEVRIAGVLLPKITKQEFAILELLLEHPKQVFSKEEIFEYAWDEHYMGETKTLDVHISNIRKKIKQVTSDEYIETVWGIGYRLHS